MAESSYRSLDFARDDNVKTSDKLSKVMKKLFTYLVLLFSLISCIKEKQTGANLGVGDAIPDFSVVMNDNTAVTGSQLSSGVCCIVFFTTLCPDCRQVLPVVQKIYDEYVFNGVRFVLISREEGSDTIAEYWSDQKFTMPYSAQTDRRIYELFAKTRVPRIYVGKNGVIKSIFTDQPENPTYDDLKACLDGVLYKY